MAVLNKGYLERVCEFTKKFQKVQYDLDATTRQLSVQEVKIGELDLRVYSFIDDSVAESHLKKQLASLDVRIAVTKTSSSIFE